MFVKSVPYSGSSSYQEILWGLSMFFRIQVDKISFNDAIRFCLVIFRWGESKLHWNGASAFNELLLSEHFIDAYVTLVLLLKHISNRIICDGFPTSCTEHTIIVNFKSRDPTIPSN